MSDSPFAHEQKSAWDVYASAEHRSAMDETAARYLDFLTRCKTERETIAYILERVEGFSEDFTTGSDAVMRVNRGKTAFFARKGRRPLSEGYRLVGSHCDTPRIDLKQHPLYESLHIGLAKTHYYGGIRKYQWLARPLALHGVIVKKDGTSVQVRVGEAPGDPVLTITDLLPHLAYKQVEMKLADAFEAEKLNLVLGHEPALESDDVKADSRVKDALLRLLNERYGVAENDLFSAELYAVPAGPALPVGLDGSFVGSYGQDDRACVFCSLEAMLAEEQPEHTQIVLFWDKEEIGSEGATGAKSLFFEYCMEELVEAWAPESRLSRVLPLGMALSADVHVAIDPDHEDVSEKLNSAFIGYGPSFSKFTGHRGKVGANDAHPEYIAFLRRILDDAGVPWQMAEMGKVDAGGGGTVAKFLAVYGMDVIDIGPAVLSMHSPFEITSKADIYATIQAFREFLKS